MVYIKFKTLLFYPSFLWHIANNSVRLSRKQIPERSFLISQQLPRNRTRKGYAPITYIYILVAVAAVAAAAAGVVVVAVVVMVVMVRIWRFSSQRNLALPSFGWKDELIPLLWRWRQQVSPKAGVYQTTWGHVPYYCRHFILVKGVLSADCFDITFCGSNINVSYSRYAYIWFNKQHCGEC